jgi:hypothetical protein
MAAFADGISAYALIDGGVASSKISGGTAASTSQTEFVTGGFAPTFVGAKFEKTIDGLTVGAQIEQGFLLNKGGSTTNYGFGYDGIAGTASDIFNRQENVFVKGSSGTFIFGTQPNIAFNTIFVGDPRSGSNFGSSLAMLDANGGLGTIDIAALSYTSPTVNGFTGAATYVPQSNTTSGDPKTGGRATLTYSSGVFTIAGATYANKINGATSGTTKADSNGNILAANYKLGSTTVKGLYASQTTDGFNTALHTYGIGAVYDLTAKTSFDAGYYNSSNGDTTQFKATTTAFGAYYKINDSFKIYSQYAVVNNNGASSLYWNFAPPTIISGSLGADQKATALNIGIQFSYF